MGSYSDGYNTEDPEIVMARSIAYWEQFYHTTPPNPNHCMRCEGIAYAVALTKGEEA